MAQKPVSGREVQVVGAALPSLNFAPEIAKDSLHFPNNDAFLAAARSERIAVLEEVFKF